MEEDLRTASFNLSSWFYIKKIVLILSSTILICGNTKEIRLVFRPLKHNFHYAVIETNHTSRQKGEDDINRFGERKVISDTFSMNAGKKIQGNQPTRWRNE